MIQKILTRMLHYLNLKETWVIFFVLGVITMNYPFIDIFNTPQRVFGMPVLFLYLFIGWLISICVIYVFVKAIGRRDADGGKEG